MERGGQANSPALVTAKYIDMFRGEANHIFKPAILDDFNPKKMDVEIAKAYLNPSEEDALLWARWGGEFGVSPLRNHGGASGRMRGQMGVRVTAAVCGTLLLSCSLWRFMALYGFLWLSLVLCGFCGSLALSGSLWLSVAMCGSLWLSLWLPVGLSGSLLLSLWLSVVSVALLLCLTLSGSL